MELAGRAIRKYRKDGINSLLRTSAELIFNNIISRLRVFFPVKRFAIWNEVYVPPEVAPKHRLIDEYISTVRTDHTKSEGGEVASHKEFTQSGDSVIIVGGGRGVTAVHAARESGVDGQVTVFEPSKRHARIIEKVMTMNNISTQYTIHNRLVGPDIHVYGESSNYDNIHPSELPSCDVLEMDCEGAELEILNELSINPRVIIMEVHPQRYSRAPEAIDKLKDIGYEIKQYRNNEGDLLSKEQFYTVLKECSKGNKPAPIVAGVRITS